MFPLTSRSFASPHPSNPHDQFSSSEFSSSERSRAARYRCERARARAREVGTPQSPTKPRKILKSNLHTLASCGDPPLLLACKAGNLGLHTMSKDAGADVSLANNRGDTPLLMACAGLILSSSVNSCTSHRAGRAGAIARLNTAIRADSHSQTLIQCESRRRRGQVGNG
jgi:hypothetical protein